MKRLANLKNSSSGTSSSTSNKRNQDSPSKKNKLNAKNNPYPASGKPYLDLPVPQSANGHLSFNTPPSGHSISYRSPNESKTSISGSTDGHAPPTIGTKSMAPTISTNPDTVNSDAVQSKAGTAGTIGISSSGHGGGEGSTFSSPSPSVRSMTTTLTTMQSAAPSALLAPNQPHGVQPAGSAAGHMHQASNATQFQHQFPTSPVSAIPPYLSSNHHVGGPQPTTYTAATANNILSDNASTMTLASSSKRRRRNSVDTNASVRALAPSSVYGGSKESLPLSVLSAHADPTTPGPYQSRQAGVSLANAERASIYSSSGIVPALQSERNSYYAAKQPAQGDGGSVRSGLMGHSRQDSIARSISGIPTIESPLQSPKDPLAYHQLSRRNSGKTETIRTDEDNVSLKK